MHLRTAATWVGLSTGGGVKASRSKGCVRTRPRDVYIGPSRPLLVWDKRTWSCLYSSSERKLFTEATTDFPPRYRVSARARSEMALAVLVDGERSVRMQLEHLPRCGGEDSGAGAEGCIAAGRCAGHRRDPTSSREVGDLRGHRGPVVGGPVRRRPGHLDGSQGPLVQVNCPDQQSGCPVDQRADTSVAERHQVCLPSTSLPPKCSAR